MAPETRKEALAKLATYDAQIGYPDRWPDDSAVEIRRDALWANVIAARRFHVGVDRRRIGKPTVREEWALPASSPDAYIDLQRNQIVLPAGFLQPPALDPGASDAANYGAIGAGLAHDVTHAIDALGAENDVQGRPRVWWSDADQKEFARRGACVVAQLDAYAEVRHQPKLVLREAIADLAGVRLAYRALMRRPVSVAEQQEFFLAYAHLRGEAMGLEAQRKLVESDAHPVPRFRVNGPLANLPEFQQAFACPARAPEQRCAAEW
jgi:endothelin-converting enzyme/putative endopeptidase